VKCYFHSKALALQLGLQTDQAQQLLNLTHTCLSQFRQMGTHAWEMEWKAVEMKAPTNSD
jgi:hypothetical protein